MTKKLWPIMAVLVILVLAGFSAWRYFRVPEAGPDYVLRSGDKVTLAGGEISLRIPDDYGLAVTADQLGVRSYTPPCDEGFDYCIYYTGDKLKDTNFEGAGVRINKRGDLKEEEACLMTPPAGHEDLVQPIEKTSEELYATAIFLTDAAAAGHYVEGHLFRVFYRKSAGCYEMEMRIGTGEFANYASGTVRKFTREEREGVTASLRGMLSTLKLEAEKAQSIVLPLNPQQ